VCRYIEMLEDHKTTVEHRSAGTEGDITEIRQRLRALVESRREVEEARRAEEEAAAALRAAALELDLARREARGARVGGGVRG
jgi:chromosome segregation ATPase